MVLARVCATLARAAAVSAVTTICSKVTVRRTTLATVITLTIVVVLARVRPASAGVTARPCGCARGQQAHADRACKTRLVVIIIERAGAVRIGRTGLGSIFTRVRTGRVEPGAIRTFGARAT